MVEKIEGDDRPEGEIKATDIADGSCKKSFAAIANITGIVKNELTNSEVGLKLYNALTIPNTAPKEDKEKAEKELEDLGFGKGSLPKIKALLPGKTYKKYSTKVKVMTSKLGNPGENSYKLLVEKFEIAVAKETGHFARYVIEEFEKLNSISEKAVSDSSLQRVTKAIENEITDTLGLNSKGR